MRHRQSSMLAALSVCMVLWSCALADSGTSSGKETSDDGPASQPDDDSAFLLDSHAMTQGESVWQQFQRDYRQARGTDWPYRSTSYPAGAWQRHELKFKNGHTAVAYGVTIGETGSAARLINASVFVDGKLVADHMDAIHTALPTSTTFARQWAHALVVTTDTHGWIVYAQSVFTMGKDRPLIQLIGSETVPLVTVDRTKIPAPYTTVTPVIISKREPLASDEGMMALDWVFAVTLYSPGLEQAHDPSAQYTVASFVIGNDRRIRWEKAATSGLLNEREEGKETSMKAPVE